VHRSDRSGQWVAIARCARESTVHVSCQHRYSKPPCPPKPAPNRSFSLSLFPIPIARAFAWTTSLLARAQRDTTPCHSLTDSLEPLLCSAQHRRPLCRTQTAAQVHIQVHAMPAAADTHPRQLCSRRDYGTLCRARLRSFPSTPTHPTPPPAPPWWASDEPGVSARGGQCQCRQGVGVVGPGMACAGRVCRI
jgi:hypothetical protein